MRIFNRVVVTLLLAGLFVLGIFGIVYSFNLFGYQFSRLPQVLNLQNIYDGVREVVSDTENGTLTDLTFFILVGVALAGVILLVLELKPRTPRRVRMEKGTYITRGAVKEQVLLAAGQLPETLGSTARVKARRRPGAKVKLKSSIRRGEDASSIRSNIQTQVADYLGRVGIPVGRVKVKTSETDPRSKGGQRVS